jgi:hypothetical protein
MDLEQQTMLTTSQDCVMQSVISNFGIDIYLNMSAEIVEKHIS